MYSTTKKKKGFTQGLITEYTHDTKNVEEVKESNETETRNEDGELFLPSPTRFLNVTDWRYRSHQAPRRRKTVASSTPTPTVAARNSTVGINVLNVVNPVANYRYVARPLLERRVRKRAVDNFQIQTAMRAVDTDPDIV